MQGDFEIVDTRDFPIVRFAADRVCSMRDMEVLLGAFDQLLAQSRDYVLLALGSHPHDEAQELAKARALFFKRNRDVLSRHCLALLVVEPDGAKRTELARQSEAASRAFGIPMRYFETVEAAWAAACALIGRQT